MNNIQFSATYSPEDNKLRLYASERLDLELYERVKDAGFKWAPKHALFVAPSWSPEREDLCMELAGDIFPEETTLAERAEIKAARLDGYREKRIDDMNSFSAAARRFAERFENGQPILIGHHSERKARTDEKRMKSAESRATKAAHTASYWGWRAEGVERHANRKADPGVRARRIKTLLADLRDRQRSLNHHKICVGLWEEISVMGDIEQRNKSINYYIGTHIKTGPTAPWSVWSDLRDGSISHDDALSATLSYHRGKANSAYLVRWISHTLNRLAYERSELGDVALFEGELTAVILQGFVREHGAHNPKAKMVGEQWQVQSSVDLPFHIGEGRELTLSADEWRLLMKQTGYEVPAPKRKQPPLLNFKADYVEGFSWGGIRTFRQIEITKAQYAAMYKDYRGAKLSSCGQFRFKICRHPDQKGYNAEFVAVYIKDAKAHPAPMSKSVISRSQYAHATRKATGEAA